MSAQEFLALLAAITAPACGYLALQVRTLYGDLKAARQELLAARAENIALLREVLDAIRQVRNGGPKAP